MSCLVRIVRLRRNVVLRELVVELQTTDSRQIVAVWVEEQVLEELLGGFDRRRITRTHALIDFDQGLFRAVNLIENQASRG